MEEDDNIAAGSGQCSSWTLLQGINCSTSVDQNNYIRWHIIVAYKIWFKIAQATCLRADCFIVNPILL